MPKLKQNGKTTSSDKPKVIKLKISMDLIQKTDNWKFNSKRKFFQDYYVCHKCKSLFEKEGSFYLHKNCKTQNEYALRITNISNNNNDEIVLISSDTESEITTDDLQVVFDPDRCDKSKSSSPKSSTKSNLTIANLEKHTIKSRQSSSAINTIQQFLQQLIHR